MFKVGDIVIRQRGAAEVMPKGTIVRIKEIRYPGKDGSVIVEGLDGRSYSANGYSTETFDLYQAPSLEERLSQARAEVARIEAEITEAAKPKVGDKFKTKDGKVTFTVLSVFEDEGTLFTAYRDDFFKRPYVIEARTWSKYDRID